ncbi:MAG TPA: hypothetical protein VGV68_15105 [Terriglobia bacterium]|nr:hypothetical protein [Terriglobia bacterium]
MVVRSQFLAFNLMALIFTSVHARSSVRAIVPPNQSLAGKPVPPLIWQSPARLHHGLRTVRGTLMVDANGIEFRSDQRNSHRWPFGEIQTFDLATHRFVLTSYENRGWHQPGDRRYRFDFSQTMPPSVAAELSLRVIKPVRNGDPDPNHPAFATIPARHTTRTGGSSGVLRFGGNGIDYVTPTQRDSRSWKWSDIQTIANPDAFHLRVGAYRETFEFELKEPMSKELFDRLWDYVYSRDLNITPLIGGNLQ